MFPLGHVGIGRQLVPSRLRAKLPAGWLAVGCLLPDLIDKPLWLAQRAGLLPEALWFLGGTRMVGHTLLLLMLLGPVAWLSRSPALIALAMGALTHQGLDLAGDIVGAPLTSWRRWFLWPLFGLEFEPATYDSFYSHLLTEPKIYFVAELIGAILLGAYCFQKLRLRDRRIE